MILNIVGVMTRERTIGLIILALLVLILVIIVTRELSCWYWKINERNSILYDIRNLLEMLNDKTDESIELMKKNRIMRHDENRLNNEEQGERKGVNNQHE